MMRLVIVVLAVFFPVLGMVRDPENIFVYVGLTAMLVWIFIRQLKTYHSNKRAVVIDTLLKVTDEEALHQALNAKLSLIYKHSTRCPVSANVYHEILKFAGRHKGVPVFQLNVPEFRELAQRIAAELDIEHQSPQAIVLKEGHAIWHASHYNIKADNLTATVKSL